MINCTLTEIKNKLTSGEVTSEQVTQACLKKIKDDNFNTFITVCESEALNTAREIDKRRARGEKLGALAGIPIAVKDNISTKGIRTTCASKFLDNYVPPFSAHVVEKLLSADAVIIGKTNMDEFAMGSTNENSAYGTALNSADVTRVAGGSSGGSASCVRACEAYASLGSDTGGSIRQPASYCGVVGLKPTYSLVSRYGLVAFASSLDQIGPITRSVKDSALMLNVIAGHDLRDSTSAETGYCDYTQLDTDIKGKTLAVAEEFFSPAISDGVKQKIQQAIDKFAKLGAKIKKVSLSSFNAALSVYYVLSSAEAATNLARFDGIKYGLRCDGADVNEIYTASRSKYFGSEVKRRIMIGNYVLSSGYYDAYYLKALKIRTLIKDEYLRALDGADAIISPVAPDVAPKLGEAILDTAKAYLQDIYTVPVNIAGLPAISIPCGEINGAPVGVQLIGKAYDEKNILSLASAFEEAK